MPRLGGGWGSEGDDERRVGRGGQDELVRPDREDPLGLGGLGWGGQRRTIGLRVELGSAARPADPEPGDCGVTPCLGRVGLEDPGGPGLGEVRGDLGVGVEIGALREVGRRGVRQLDTATPTSSTSAPRA